MNERVTFMQILNLLGNIGTELVEICSKADNPCSMVTYFFFKGLILFRIASARYTELALIENDDFTPLNGRPTLH